MRFLDLELQDWVPDATTIWLFREALAQAGLIDKLFERFGQHLEAEGYIARGGQIIDATIVSVPRQRNTKEENETIKAGKTRRRRDGSSIPPRMPRRTRTTSPCQIFGSGHRCRRGAGASDAQARSAGKLCSPF